ncbi:MAG: rRNA maturation RNase YbeY [Chloroflexota bacterium]
MTLRVHVRRRKSFARHGASVAQAARATLTFAGARQAEVTVVLTHEEEIREFNRRYAGEDATTDVLAFGDGSTDPESGVHYLGDVVIAVPVAAQQAAAAGHPLEDELALLTVHGVLHLLGHDHDDPAARARMDDAQQAVLSQLGIGLRRPPEAP